MDEWSRAMDTVPVVLSRYPNRMSWNPGEGRSNICLRKLADFSDIVLLILRVIMNLKINIVLERLTNDARF